MCVIVENGYVEISLIILNGDVFLFKVQYAAGCPVARNDSGLG